MKNTFSCSCGMKSDTLCLVNSIGDFGKDVGDALDPTSWFRVSLDYVKCTLIIFCH